MNKTIKQIKVVRVKMVVEKRDKFYSKMRDGVPSKFFSALIIIHHQLSSINIIKYLGGLT